MIKHFEECWQVASYTNEEILRHGASVSGDALEEVINRAEPAELVNDIAQLETKNENLEELVESQGDRIIELEKLLTFHEIELP